MPRVYEARSRLRLGPITQEAHRRRMTAIDDPRQSLENLKLERDAIVLYDSLASIEKDPRRAAAFQRIAGNERRHADIWAGKLRELGVHVPPAGAPRMRIRAIVLLA